MLFCYYSGVEIITRYCNEECCFTCFQLQFHRHQKQIYSFYKTSYSRDNAYLAFRCVFGALSDVYNHRISFLCQPWWPAVMQVPYILTISPLFPQQSKPSYSTASWSNRKKIFKSFCCSNKWLIFPSFLFILLQFKSHQTLYISVVLAHSFNTLLSYSIHLWNLSCHI